MAVIVLRRTPPLTVWLIALTLLMSITVAIDARTGGALYRHLSLLPEAVWRGQVWRLVTWPFIQAAPLSLILTCVALYAFGSDLLTTWGRARYLRYLGGIVLGAGAGTCVVALVMPAAWWSMYLGGMVLIDALVIGWARQFPDQPVSIYFVLVLRGSALVSVLIATTLVFAAFFGVARMLPELLAIAAALLYLDRTHHRLWLKLKLRRVRRRLRVVRADGSFA